MSSIQNIDLSLQDIIKTMGKDAYLIPKFQRDFVWKGNDITDLGDSIIRGYPISSLLIMPENGTLNVGSHSLARDYISDDNKGNHDDVRYYVLDGQQRLTSMSKLFLNFDKKNEYYFDLLSILVAKYPEDNIVEKRFASDSFCRSFPLAKDGCEKPTRQNNRFISGKSIIENRFGSVVNKFLRQFTNFSEEAFDKYTDYLNALFGSVGGYSIPATIIAKDSDLGVVIRVFEKVNSTGKKLTLFDLINAKSFQTKVQKYSMGFTDYVTNQLISKIDYNYHANAIQKYLKYDENHHTFERLDRIVRILEISYLLKNNQTPSIFNSVMLSREADFWFEEWDKSCDTFIEIVDWIVSEGLADIGQTTYLEYVIAILIANPNVLKIGSFKQKIKSYAYYLSLAGIPFNKSNLDIVELLYDMSNKMLQKMDYNDLSYSINLTEEDILAITPSTAKFQTILNIFYLDKIEGNFTVDLVGNEIKYNQLDHMDRHHIFPKSKVKNFTSKNKFNSIANQILLGFFDNREKFKDKSPSEYVNLIDLSKEKIEFVCKQNLIDYTLLSQIETEEDAEKLLKERAKLIAEILNRNIVSSNN